MSAAKNPRILVCDDSVHSRRLIADVLRGAGLDDLRFARDGEELLTTTVESAPRVVLAVSRLPKLSGLEFTRQVRAGFSTIDRALSIIIMTTTPTQSFLDIARSSGVDEILLKPFSAQALLTRVEAVLLRPRRFIESMRYTGPCRRRRMVDDYGGPLRRFSDPLDEIDLVPWEAPTNRELVRSCVHKINDLAERMRPGDRRKLREVYAAVRDTEQLADDVRDAAMAAAARSLGRYITAIGASGALDMEVVSTHIDSMQKLSFLGSDAHRERQQLIDGLIAIVNKRLGATHAA